MNKTSALVENAADPSQVKRAGRKERDVREQELADIRAVLETAPGRRLVWRLLGHCKVFESIWHPSALIHHNAGKQDVGHFLMAEVVAADEGKLFDMMQEARAKAQRDAAESQALKQNGDSDA